MQPRSPQERQAIIDANPHLTVEVIDRDLAEMDQLLAARDCSPNEDEAHKQARNVRIREIAEKLSPDLNLE